jgi:hypothetical protein
VLRRSASCGSVGCKTSTRINNRCSRKLHEASDGARRTKSKGKRTLDRACSLLRTYSYIFRVSNVCALEHRKPNSPMNPKVRHSWLHAAPQNETARRISINTGWFTSRGYSRRWHKQNHQRPELCVALSVNAQRDEQSHPSSHIISNLTTYYLSKQTQSTMNRTRALNMGTSYFRSAINRSLAESTVSKRVVQQGDNRSVGSLSCHIARPSKNSAALTTPSSITFPNLELASVEAGWRPLGFSS